MRLHFELTEADLAALKRHDGSITAQQVAQQAQQKIYSGVLALGLFPLLIIGGMLLTGGAPWPAYLLVLVPGALYTGMWTFLYRTVLLPSMDSGFRRLTAHLLGPHAFELTAEGVRDAGPSGESFHKWSAVDSVHDPPESVFTMLRNTHGGPDEESSVSCFGGSGRA